VKYPPFFKKVEGLGVLSPKSAFLLVTGTTDPMQVKEMFPRSTSEVNLIWRALLAWSDEPDNQRYQYTTLRQLFLLCAAYLLRWEDEHNKEVIPCP